MPQTLFDILFWFNNYPPIAKETPFDFRCFFKKGTARRKHRIHPVVGIQPITDTPMQVRPHVCKCVFTRDVRQVFVVGIFRPFAVLATDNVFITFVFFNDTGIHSCTLTDGIY